MTNDPFPFYDFLSQKQLGVLFGVSSHVIGSWLRQIGVRNSDGSPTTDAVSTGLAKAVIFADAVIPFFSWDKIGTIKLLEEAGHKKKCGLPEQVAVPVTLKGPYTSRGNGGDGFELLDGDGSACIWVRGQGNADLLVKVLTVVDRFRSQLPAM
jgi:hypothetical protein